MRISLNFLKDFVDLKVKDPLLLKEKLTSSVAEIETMEDFSLMFKNVVTGKLLTFNKHPKDNRLHVSIMDLGKYGKKQIIFGSVFQVEKGWIMPVCLPKTHLKSGLIIEETEIKGVKSEGMIASDEELSLPISESGLTVFPQSTPLGTSITKILDLEDIIFDIDNHALTNRGDLFSEYGFAREFVANGLAVWKKGKDKIEINIKEGKEKFPFSINITEENLSPSYAAIVIDNVKIAPSPLWIKKRLINCGIRPILNIVDITNYVMLELGMPLHAFDSDSFSDSKLIMRKSRKGEKVITLDGKQRELPDNVIVIENNGILVDLCGIMGGKNSGIKNTTKRILLHSPIYNPLLIRKAIWNLNLRTDAATIYEKGIDETLAILGLKRAAELITNLMPEAHIASKIFNINKYKNERKSIIVKEENVKNLIGIKVKKQEIKKILAEIGCEIKGNKVIPPSFRPDLKLEADLIEEVARIYGFEKIPNVSPTGAVIQHKKDRKRILEKKIKELLIASSWNEACTFSFLGENLLDKLSFIQKNEIAVLNPISEDMAFMRQSLLPRLLESASQNFRNFPVLKLFELGKVYFMKGKKPCEEKFLAGVCIGEKPFFEIKGVLTEILEKLNFSPVLEKTCEYSFEHPGRSAEIKIKNTSLGLISELKPNIARKMNIKANVGIFEINFDLLSSIEGSKKEFKELPSYPSVPFDISILVQKKAPSEKFTRILQNLNPSLIKKIELIDIYEGKNLPSSQKSLTYSLIFQALDRTLKEEEITELKEKVISALAKNGGILRG